MSNINFDKLNIIGPTDDQYEGVESYKDRARIEFSNDVINLSSPDQLPKDLKKLMIFDDVKAIAVFNDTFVEGDIVIVM